jgi:glycosyltransferase involved in cell wall biosynthesis|tara:strand:+ start:1622 stop:2773 length:1152 start_codon:yes stop_codon:yes gene_type:complete
MGADCVWESPVFDASGYAKAARYLLLGLDALGANIRLNQFRNWSLLDVDIPESQFKTFKTMMDRDLTGAVPCVMMKIPDAYEFQWGLESKQIGYTMFEVDGIPKKWVGILRMCDEVWVPSTFNKKTFADSGVEKDKIQVMPLGVDTEHFKPGAEPIKINNINDDTFVFLSVFQWSIRKGWDVLIDAYLEEFDRDENVCLVLKTYEATPGDPICENIIRNCVLGIKKMIGDRKRDKFPRILWYKDLIADQQMPSLYSAADAFVLPTRGEGWNLPGIEAMSMGLPTICTRWSAHLDFMNDKNSFLIDVDRVSSEHAGEMHRIHTGYFEMKWATPSITHLRKLMRFVYENRKMSAKIGKRARKDMIKNWTWDHATKKINDRLLELM